MNLDLSYFIQHGLITIFTMACIHAFLQANKTLSKDIKRKFLLLTTVLMIEGLEAYIDHVLSIPNENNFNYLRVAVSVVGYIARPIMLYIVLLIMQRDLQWKGKKIILAIPSIVTSIVAFMAFFTKAVFYYDENNVFHGGPLRYVFFAMLIIYLLIVFVTNIIVCKNNKAERNIIFGIIIMLTFDWVLALFFDNINLHEELEAISAILYFMYFISVYNEEKLEEKDQEHLELEQQMAKSMLDQSIETLAYTIDAKDRYTKGHSLRVAKYSRMIAVVAGKSDEECRQIYLAGLLHDIGKISIDDLIINKKGKLTDEEYEKIKTHPAKGTLILEKMKTIPFLLNGAKYHHERYDGEGYPNGLKGTEIPEMARIIAVADAYDAMTSYRSYRPIMDQVIVREEIWKGLGAQFDPMFGKIMISLIDADPYYTMREIRNKQDDIAFDDDISHIAWPSAMIKDFRDTLLENTTEEKTEIDDKPAEKILQSQEVNTLAFYINIEEKWGNIFDGFVVTEECQKVSFKGVTRPESSLIWAAPLILIYSSDNGEVLGPNYDELGVFMGAGYGWQSGSSLYEYSGFTREAKFESWDNWLNKNKEGLVHTITYQMDLNENMVVISIENGLLTMNIHLAMPEDYGREVRIAISGYECDLYDFTRI